KRSLSEPLYPHHSVRVFPPTNIVADVYYKKTVYPNEKNEFILKLEGLKSHNEQLKTVDLWKLKGVAWTLVETTNTTSPACHKHARMGPGAAKDVQGAPVKGIARTTARVIGSEFLYDGWKSDVSID
ncbi:hypothetical protein PLICBS_003872, partial [Purpureocillium lilacinum]|uniref:uncharacterized protein n=1 Tax=Purpureocillium lilacinum TaxID=33203 RepID=UPI002086B2C6